MLPRTFETVAAERRGAGPAGTRRAAGRAGHRRHRRRAADVPVVLKAIGTVQAYNMVTIKSRVDGQIVKVDFTEGQNVKAGTRCSRSIRGRSRRRSSRPRRPSRRTRRSSPAPRPISPAGPQLVSQRLSDRGRPTTRQKAQVAQLQAAIKGDEAQIDDGAAEPRLCRRSARRSTAGSAPGWSISATWCAPPTAPALVTIAQVKPIFVSFTVPQENQHKIREKQTQAPLVVQAMGDDGKTLLSTGKLTLIDNAIDQTTGTI